MGYQPQAWLVVGREAKELQGYYSQLLWGEEVGEMEIVAYNDVTNQSDECLIGIVVVIAENFFPYELSSPDVVERISAAREAFKRRSGLEANTYLVAKEGDDVDTIY